ncbi:hypothetical protein MHBO_002388, partial [Bonamia ostreae]
MPSKTRLHIGKLTEKTEGQELEKELEKYGEVVDFELYSDYAYVDYKTQKEAQEAIDGLNGKKYDGNTLEVEFDSGSKSQSNSASKSGSRGRSRSRSQNRGRSRSRSQNRGRSRSRSRRRSRRSPSYRRRSPPYRGRNGFRGSKFGTKCFNCGVEGHFARDCTETNWTF